MLTLDLVLKQSLYISLYTLRFSDRKTMLPTHPPSYRNKLKDSAPDRQKQKIYLQFV